MIPVEVEEPSTRRLLFQQQQNKENMRVEFETTNEVQEMVRIKEEATKLWTSRRYNKKVQPRAFQPGDLTWRVRDETRKDPQAGNHDPNLEDPFGVTTSLDNEAYRIQELDGKAIPRTWNATHLSSTSVDLLQNRVLYSFSYSSLLSQKRKIMVFTWEVLMRHIRGNEGNLYSIDYIEWNSTSFHIL